MSLINTIIPDHKAKDAIGYEIVHVCLYLPSEAWPAPKSKGP